MERSDRLEHVNVVDCCVDQSRDVRSGWTARRVRDVEDRSPLNNGDEFVARCGVVFVQRPN